MPKELFMGVSNIVGGNLQTMFFHPMTSYMIHFVIRSCSNNDHKHFRFRFITL